MSALPPEVLDEIEAREGAWSFYSSDNRLRLSAVWEDVIEVARTSDWWKRETDDHHVAIDGWKDSMTGCDTHGRRIYLTGKWVYYRGERRWFVITYHEDERST